MSKKASVSAKKVVFEGATGAKSFDVCWDAFRLTYPTEAKGYDKLKLCNKLGHLLKGISDLTPKDRDEYGRTLKDDEPQVLLLVQDVYDLLLRMLNSDQVQWSFLKGDDAELAIKWLRAVESVDLSENEEKAKEEGTVTEAMKEAPDAADWSFPESSCVCAQVRRRLRG